MADQVTLSRIPPELQPFFRRRCRRAIVLTLVSGGIVFLVALAALVYLTDFFQRAPEVDTLLTALQLSAAVGLLLPFAGLRLFPPLQWKSTKFLLALTAALWGTALVLFLALALDFNPWGPDRMLPVIICFSLATAVNGYLYVSLLDMELLLAAEGRLHIPTLGVNEPVASSAVPAPDRKEDA